jgi:hypothetical protein
VGGLTKGAAVAAVVATAGLCLAACSDSGGTKAANKSSSPSVVVPTAIGGGSGQGPIYGSNSGSPISLPDRSIAIESFTERYQKSNKAEFVDISMTIANNSAAPINNEPKFFELIGQGGDVFSYQDNSSDTFYGPLGPHDSRTGLIEFEIPAAAAKGLELLYRPDVATGTVIARLNPS